MKLEKEMSAQGKLRVHPELASPCSAYGTFGRKAT